MRHALAYYCSDLTDPHAKFNPIGVIVVDEKSQDYALRFLSCEEWPKQEQPSDELSAEVWTALPETLRQKFLDYKNSPHHKNYILLMGKENYHGFISQIVHDYSRSSICFGPSQLIKDERTIEEIADSLFKNLKKR